MSYRRPQTAKSRMSGSESQMSDLMTVSSEMKILQNQGECQWNNKVNTQMKGLTRYKIDYQKKMGQLRNLPKIEMSLYDDLRFKQFLKNNFLTISKIDFTSPPSDLKRNKPFRPETTKGVEYVSQNNTRYQQEFRNYSIRDDDKCNKPMPNSIKIGKQDLNAVSHYQQTFGQKQMSRTNMCNSAKQSTISITSSLPFYDQTEHKTQYRQYNTKKQGLSINPDNLFSSLSFKGQYLTEAQKQFQNKLKKRKK